MSIRAALSSATMTTTRTRAACHAGTASMILGSTTTMVLTDGTVPGTMAVGTVAGMIPGIMAMPAGMIPGIMATTAGAGRTGTDGMAGIILTGAAALSSTAVE